MKKRIRPSPPAFRPAVPPVAGPSLPADAPTPHPVLGALAERWMSLCAARPSFGLGALVRQFLIFCAAFLLLGFLLALVLPGIKPSWRWAVDEAPLSKNAAFALSPGQSLEYALSGPDGARAVRLAAMAHARCQGVLMSDVSTAQSAHNSLPAAMAAEPGVYAVCVGSDGVERALDCSTGRAAWSCGRRLGSNLSFSNTSWPYFSPWMLALSGHFSWSANLTLEAYPFNVSSSAPIQIRVTNRTIWQGRRAFEVEMRGGALSPLSTSENPASPPETLLSPPEPLRLLVDEQYRVLLYSQSGPLTIRLVRAPFALNATDAAASP